jgi:hypothetical protein
MAQHRHPDKNFNQTYLYHSRSDKHSVQLCTYVVADLLKSSETLRRDAEAGNIVFGINIPFRAPSGKTKNLDFAIGRPVNPPAQTEILLGEGIACVREIAELLISCEAKSVMTEHSKSKPRVYDELSSSHEIVHQGKPDAIATGIAVVNIAKTFVSPLRQKSDAAVVSSHTQPAAAAGMIRHLRDLSIRDTGTGVGFEAFCTIVLDCDNVSCAKLWSDPPAPQPGERDHYATYVTRVSRFYEERFG